jgi:hypothetical protein
MATICFYQDTRHEKPLKWIRKVLGIGYLSRRKDGMSELRINGFKQVREILSYLLPFIRFKKFQAKALREACEILAKGTLKTLDTRALRRLVSLILVIQRENYATKNKKTKDELLLKVGLTP